MDKKRKKEIKKEYLRQELLKQVQSDNEIIANWAKERLGKSKDQPDLKKLVLENDEDLEEKIFFLIEDKIKRIKRDNRKPSDNEVLQKLSDPEKLVFYTYILDSEIAINGVLSYYINSAGEHIIPTLHLLENLKFEPIISILEKSIGNFIELEEGDFEYWSGDISKWKSIENSINKEYYIIKGRNYSFHEFDQDYLKIEEEFRKIRFQYIRNNIESFS
ncbi:DUF4375 domain-containing protein [uncultured Christiangramia sp.]|uniref:DMP19 family protein n=1 Tax=Christiangramia sp. 3-2217-3z TaxID=3417564 RepID=UPI0026069C90|nr:DUF4375 domain-containing protein [uncultured Christiangramia sp.]